MSSYRFCSTDIVDSLILEPFIGNQNLARGETIENTTQRGICMRGRHSGFMYRVLREKLKNTNTCYRQCGGGVVMKHTVAMLLSDT